MENQRWVRLFGLYVGQAVFLLLMAIPLMQRMIFWAEIWYFAWLLIVILFGPIFFFIYRARWLALRIVKREVDQELVWAWSYGLTIFSGAGMVMLGGIGTEHWLGLFRIGEQPIVLMMQVVLATFMVVSPYGSAIVIQAIQREKRERDEADK